MIRALADTDRTGWEPLWEGYLRFYRQSLPPSVTDTTFERLCARRDGLFGYVAEEDGVLVGLAHGVVHGSTWSTAPVCYLSDLFVDPAARGGEVARALIDAVLAEARTLGAAEVYWHTQEFNGRARSLYDQVGELRSWVVYEVPLRPDPGSPAVTG
ncbi:MAG TPA: GNAT family N-acetyltransferase [Acidimicrobiales bacterium]|nr:GNAT family N-acetyltransferase [Acidimicrobiales bacterium]